MCLVGLSEEIFKEPVKISVTTALGTVRLCVHPNDLAVSPMAQSDKRRLRRHQPNDLLTRLIVQLSDLWLQSLRFSS
jgi:hypothetical protein